LMPDPQQAAHFIYKKEGLQRLNNLVNVLCKF